MKVAIYVRTSRTDQNLENQLIPLKRYCEMHGFKDVTVFEEQVSTRKTRPVQYGLYNDLLKHKFDMLLIYKFDRWARSSQELIIHMNEFNDRGVTFVSFTENIDTSTHMGKLMFTILSAFAQFERDIIRERTLAGLERARAKGKKLGRPMKGKEKPKPAIRDVAKLSLKGLSIRDIAKELGTTKYWVEWSLKEMKDKPEKVEGVF